MTAVVQSRDARTGENSELPITQTDPATVEALARHARIAAGWLSAIGIDGRAGLLDQIADRLESSREQLVPAADAETALGATRLNGEIARTAWQLRFLGNVIRDGQYLELTVDDAVEGPIGPQPDLRRMQVPLGPVGVFGASNFPFAFSTIGGDSASALAVGCPVIFKAHPGHPRTTAMTDDIVREAIAAAGGPDGVFQTVYGHEAGTALVEAADICAVGFTGSLSGGRALFDLAARRPVPIPFYGELGSVNPVVVTTAAARERSTDIGRGAAASLLLGAGQFCTKPGIILIPAGPDGDAAATALVEAVTAAECGPLLTEGIQTRFADQIQQSSKHPAAARVARAADGLTPALVVEVDAAAVLADPSDSILEEHFGPFGVIVRYSNHGQRDQVLAALPSALTGTVQAATTEDDELLALVEALAQRSGRVIVNQYPTGVAVSWAMQHGGPYPSATAPQATSVGAHAIQRWLRPVTYQNTPSAALPPQLRDEDLSALPHRRNGIQRLPQR